MMVYFVVLGRTVSDMNVCGVLWQGREEEEDGGGLRKRITQNGERDSGMKLTEKRLILGDGVLVETEGARAARGGFRLFIAEGRWELGRQGWLVGW